MPLTAEKMKIQSFTHKKAWWQKYFSIGYSEALSKQQQIAFEVELLISETIFISHHNRFFSYLLISLYLTYSFT